MGRLTPPAAARKGRSAKAKQSRTVRPAPTASACTLHDVARRAAVSIKTVSRVVNREPNVRPEKIARVQEAITSLGYLPNLSARNLARPLASLIALIYNDNSANNHYIVGLQDGAVHVCQQFNYSFLLQPAKYDSPRMLEDMLTLIAHRRPSGLVITPPLCDVTSLLDVLDGRNVDYVLISSIHTARRGSVVRIDERRASFEITKYLLSLGHKRIGFVSGHPDHSSSTFRLEGYLGAHRESGVEVNSSLIMQGEFTFESGLECGRALLTRESRPSAIYAANDESAVGVLHVAHDLNIRVPEQLSVAGFDDAPESRYVWPTLTTVRQPIAAMAETAVKLLISPNPRNPGQSSVAAVTNRNILMPHELVVRQSTAPPDLKR